MTNGERIEALDAVKRGEVFPLPRALIRAEVRRLRWRSMERIAIGVGLGVLAFAIAFAATAYLMKSRYSESERAVIESCRARNEIPVVYHSGDGKVLGIRCQKDKWGEHIERDELP